LKTITLLSHDSATISLLRAIAPSLHCTLHVIADWEKFAQQSGRIQNSKLVIADLQTIANSHVPLSAAISALRRVAPGSKIVLTAPRSKLIEDYDREWAKNLGADALVPQMRATRWSVIKSQILGAINDDAAAIDADANRVTPFIRVAQRAERKDEALVGVAALESAGVDLPSLALRIGRSGGVPIRDRTYHLRTYEECFVAAEAVSWIAAAHRTNSTTAIAIGKALQATGLIYHVAREQLFAEENFFFRVTKIPALGALEDLAAQVVASTGFDRRDRNYLGTTYTHCFVGSEATEWLVKRGYSINEAMSIMQRLMDLSIIAHVTDDQPFKSGNFFYRFNAE
jgi:hypothetical protein